MDNNNHTCEQGCCGEFCSRYKGVIIAVGVFLSLFLLARAFHEFRLLSLEGRNTYPSNIVTVIGEGKVTTVPDIASFNYTVTEEGKSVADAQKKARDKGNKAVAFLKGNGIQEGDIKTLNYNINPKYEYQQAPCNGFLCPPGKQVLKGYEVSQNISVKVRKTEDAGKILSGIGELGVNNVGSLEFTIDDEEALKAKARVAAIDDAKNKAEELSKNLNVKLVKVVSFYEEGDQPVPFFDREGMGADMKIMAAVPELPQGENMITKRVTITYEIR